MLGIDVPMATALVDAAAARRDYLDETGGRYVHLIAYGDIETGGDIAKALACGADAVMLGEPLAVADQAPRAAAGTGTRPPPTRGCRARRSSISPPGSTSVRRWRNCCSARPRNPVANATSSARFVG